MAKLNFEVREADKGVRPIRRNVLFFIVLGLSLYMGIWIMARGWQLSNAGLNLNWFHEYLGVFLLLLWCAWCYKELYQQSEVFLEAKAVKEEEERLAKESAHEAVEAKQQKVFQEFIRIFEVANTFSEKNAAMVNLLKVGLESQVLRQKVLDLVASQNEWMRESELFLSTQNLISWRIKNELFEVSTRFTTDGETQDMSIKTINMMESIVKRHIEDYRQGLTNKTLNLSGKIVPTLSLGALKVPEGALLFDEGYFWQASFSETEFVNTSFIKAHLQGASFWKAHLVNVNFREAILSAVKLRTDIQQVKNLTSDQFFSTKEWELAFLSTSQMDTFFPNQVEGNPEWDKWIEESPKRDRLYFNKEQIDKIKTSINN